MAKIAPKNAGFFNRNTKPRSDGAGPKGDPGGLFRFNTLLILYIKFFAALAVMGFIFGSYVSPPFEDDTVGQRVLAKFIHINARDGVEVEHVDSSISEATGEAIIPIRRFTKTSAPSRILVCGPITYVYSPLIGKVTTRPATADDLPHDITKAARPPLPPLDFFVGAIGTGGTLYSMQSASQQFRTSWQVKTSMGRGNSLVIAAIGTVSGFYLGYKFGFKSIPKCGGEKIANWLKDEKIWQAAPEPESDAGSPKMKLRPLN